MNVIVPLGALFKGDACPRCLPIILLRLSILRRTTVHQVFMFLSISTLVERLGGQRRDLFSTGGFMSFASKTRRKLIRFTWQRITACFDCVT